MVNIFSPVVTSRLHYVLGVIFRDHLRIPYRITADRTVWLQSSGIKLHYSNEFLPGSFRIPSCGILSETYMSGQVPAADPMQGAVPLSSKHLGVSFGADPSLTGWPFDLFGAVFYLLSRYEEYLPEAVYDPFDRYDPTASWAYRQGLLERPIVDEWIVRLGRILTMGDPEANPELSSPRFAPTYDIDLPWCYRHKPLKISILSFFRHLGAGQWGAAVEQWKVQTGRIRDPFDNFDWLDSVHEALEGMETPVYFFPVSGARNKFDKGPSPGNPAYQDLIARHSARYPVGIHPSYYSTTEEGLLSAEIGLLSRITGLPVTISRFHYIRFRLPGAYRLLLDNGIRADYSMGYGEYNGFRASYSRPFPWYDLERETETPLKVVPFCFMEATSYYTRHQDAKTTQDELDHYREALEATGGRLATIWHNSSLSDTPRWIGWRSLYRHFLTHITPDIPA